MELAVLQAWRYMYSTYLFRQLSAFEKVVPQEKRRCVFPKIKGAIKKNRTPSLSVFCWFFYLSGFFSLFFGLENFISRWFVTCICSLGTMGHIYVSKNNVILKHILYTIVEKVYKYTKKIKQKYICIYIFF